MIFLLILGLICPAQAQITDLVGTLAIDGMMTAQATKGYNTANLQTKKNQLTQELQMKNIEIQTLMISNSKNVSRETFSISGYPASAKTEENGGFSITLKQVEKAICQTIEDRFANTKKVEINNKNFDKNNCSDKNIIKFYY